MQDDSPNINQTDSGTQNSDVLGSAQPDSSQPQAVNDGQSTDTPSLTIKPPEENTDDSTVSTPADDSLVDIKRQALEQLQPLVSHLEQTPEEKFQTLLMMIQASDNKDLLKEAFETAGAITDDKARAQALLDVINEINYFSQPKENG